MTMTLAALPIKLMMIWFDETKVLLQNIWEQISWLLNINQVSDKKRCTVLFPLKAFIMSSQFFTFHNTENVRKLSSKFVMLLIACIYERHSHIMFHLMKLRSKHIYTELLLEGYFKTGNTCGLRCV
jgi:hypothetical protein